MSGDDHRHLGTGLPLDDVGSNEIDLAGRVAELLDRLDRTLAALGSARSVTDWMDALRTACATSPTYLPTTPGSSLTARARAAMAEAQDGASRAPACRRTGSARWSPGRPPTRANFRTGTLTVCTMVPMRSVPHRVVCLLGLDDGSSRGPGSSTATTSSPAR